MTREEENRILRDYEFFIRQTASRALKRTVTRSDEAYSTALSAFWEALQDYSPEKGSLEAYAAVVIRHRLLDDIRKQKSRAPEISVAPVTFGGDPDGESAAMQRAIERRMAEKAPDSILREEIEELRAELERYHIDFFDLPESSPKARKTRNVCLRAGFFVSRTAVLLARLRRTLRLPSAEMETGVPISRKLLEKFRKYIITVTEIDAGDFPGLREYLVQKEES